jgi:peptidoglycan/xylan/chitin deacetylase (PgdA/CDA1 family)
MTIFIFSPYNFFVFRSLTPLLAFCFFGLISTAQTTQDVATLARKQVPILCYHQIRDWRASDRKIDKDYIIPPATFGMQMKMLADSGYHTILPDELYDYLVSGKPIPPKSIILTFDDTDGDQFTAARPELNKYNFKAVYFIVTNNISKNKYYMDRKQIRQLSDEGNIIACHTRDHMDFKKLKGLDWEAQIDVSKRKLEQITGKPVNYFAFPYGSWNREGLPELHKRGFKAAFQLDQPRDPKEPLMTIRRIITCGYWSAQTLDYNIKHDFGRPVKKPVMITAAK